MNFNHVVFRRGFVHALGTVAYIAAVATVMFNAERIFGPDSGDGDTVLAPISFLLLFVTSAAVTGWLVAGTPLRWYLDGKKQEAVQLLGYTVSWLATFAVLAFVLLSIR